MKVKITLKDPQKECLDKVTSDLSLENNEKTIHKLIHGIFELNQNDDVFGDYRCVGDCYTTEQSVILTIFSYMINLHTIYFDYILHPHHTDSF